MKKYCMGGSGLHLLWLAVLVSMQAGFSNLAALEAGDQCPEFSLDASDGITYSSKDFIGKVPVVIAWFPKAFTGGCTRECLSFQDASKALDQFDVIYFAASVDGVDRNREFAESLGLSFPVLSDPFKLAASAFGVVDEEQPLARRWTFYIGADGFIRHVDRSINVSDAGKDVAARMASLDFPEKPQAANSLAISEESVGWRLLFDGKDTSRWMTEMRNPTRAPVGDQAILASGSGGGMVLYADPFSNFELSLDIRMESDFSNSGIFIRMSDLHDPFPNSFEVQVVGAGGGGYSAFGSILDLAPSPAASFDPQSWNNVCVRANGPAITTWVNHKKAAHLDTSVFTESGLRPDGSRHKYGIVRDMPHAGFIGFQDLDSKVWYRNIKIRELP